MELQYQQVIEYPLNYREVLKCMYNPYESKKKHTITERNP